MSEEEKQSKLEGGSNEVVARLIQRLPDLEHTSVRVQQSALQFITQQVLDGPNDVYPAGPLKRAARCVIWQLVSGKYLDKSLVNQAYEFVRRGSAQYPQIDFKQTVSELLLANLDDLASPGGYLHAIRITCELMTHFDGFTSQWPVECMQIQAFALEHLANVRKAENLVKSGVSALQKLWKQRPELHIGYNDVWGAPAHIQSSLFAFSELSKFVQSHNPSYYEEVLKRATADAFVTHVLNGKKPVSDAALANVVSALNQTNSSEFMAFFSDPISKTLKRSPEGASRPVAALVSAMATVDLSEMAVEHLAPAALRMVKSPKEDVRTNGLLLCEALAKKTGNIEAFVRVVGLFSDAVAGKGGALAQVYMKSAVVRALRYCASSSVVEQFGRESVDEIGAGVVATIIAFVDKEGDDSTRYQAMLALGEWAAAMSPLSDALKAKIVAGSANKSKPVATGWLAVLHIAVSQGPYAADHLAAAGDSAIIEALAKVVSDATKKPLVSQTDAAVALDILLELSVGNATALGAMDRLRLWSCVSAADSFLFSRALLQQITARDAEEGSSEVNDIVVTCVVSSIAVVVQQFGNKAIVFQSVNQDGPAESDLASTIEQSLEGIEGQTPSHLAVPYAVVNFLLHSDRKLLAKLDKNIRMITSTNEAAIHSLITALQLHVVNAATEVDRIRTATVMSADERAKEQQSDKIGLPSDRFIAVIFALIEAAPTRAILPSLLFLVAHPIVSSSLNTARKLWQKVLLLTSTATPAADANFLIPEVSAWMHSAAMHTSPQLITATAHALILLAESKEFSTEAVAQNVLLNLLSQIQQSDFARLSEREIEIYLRGAEEGEDAEDAKNAVSMARRRRQRSGRRQQAYNAEDDEWEAQVRAELQTKAKAEAESSKKAGAASSKAKPTRAAATKGPGAAESDGLSDSQRAHMQREITRDKVRQLKAQVDRILTILKTFVHDAPSLGRTTTSLIVPVVYPLLRSILVADGAFQCIAALAHIVESSLTDLSQTIADALRISAVAIDRPLAKRETPDTLYRAGVEWSGPLVRSVKGISKVVDRHDLEPATIHLIFPILKAILSLPAMIPGCEDAFKIVNESVYLPSFNEDEDDLEHKKAEDDKFELIRPLRKDMIELSLKVMTTMPKIQPNPEDVLQILTAEVPLSPAEWSPLLGSVGLLNPEPQVRSACLQAIFSMLDMGIELSANMLLESRVWLVVHDADERCAQQAALIWGALGTSLSTTYLTPLLALMQHDFEHVRLAAAAASVAGLKVHPSTAEELIAKFIELFRSCVKVHKEVDITSDLQRYLSAPIGLESKEPEDAKWPARVAVGRALFCLGNTSAVDASQSSLIHSVLEFIVRQGVIDENDAVRAEMLTAGVAVVRNYGETMKTPFVALCDDTLAQRPVEGESIQQFDWRREAAVVLLGAAAKHLDPTEERLAGILQSLVRALGTPSESVQVAVADNIAALGPAVKVHGNDLLDQLIGTALSGASYADRRGGAYGVAAIVKALGIPVLKQSNVIDRLRDAVATGSISNKQGALFCFETLSDRLGLLFEPYVIVILPVLLQSFSDTSDHVRDAAQGAAKIIMQKLSAAGVKQVLTPILRAVPDTNWRTKREAIRLLGTMAYCAPRQLASCLPQIVPKLCEAFTDPHPKVKEAARTSLQDIGSVVRNPEVSRLSGILLAALSDPAKGTKPALEALLETEFMHSIDAPSLAILAPILQRGLKDRGADVKRKAAVITGNMTSMISDPKMLVPYLDDLIPGLKLVLVDPIPDVRARAAKALGSLTTGLGDGNGEGEFGTLVPWLIDTLKAETSSVERSGGAQGLAEVLIALGVERVSTVLAELLPLKSHPKYNVREGVIWLLCFLPPALGDDFAGHIPETLPVILTGLSDEAESVRDVAMRAGQVLVSAHGRNHPMLLLPTLEQGLFDDDWRIRQSSVQLLGDLLYLISGTKALGLADDDQDQDDDISNTSSKAATVIREHIGADRTDSVLASLYIVRSDTSAVVRQSTLQVWKTIVNNTPRTLREIMPKLIDNIIKSLASNSYDKRTVAGRALGDVVRKLGDQVLPEIVPFLRQGLKKGDRHMRQGVCLGLSEIMVCATKRQIEFYLETLIPAVQDALCDVSVDVREQAAVAFQALQKVVGARAVEEVVPSLMRMLEEGAAELDTTDSLVPPNSNVERALFGLKAVVQLKTRDLMQYLLPKLLRRPISTSQALALGGVFEVSGSSIHYHLHQVIPTLVDELAEVCPAKSPTWAFVEFAAIKLGAHIDTTGVQALAVQLGQQISSDNPLARQYAIWILEQFLKNTRADFEEQVPIFLKDLLQRLTDAHEPVLYATSAALQALNARLPMDELIRHLEFTRTVLTSMISDAKHRRHGTLDREFLLPGFNIPKGLDPILPMFFEGLMHGTPMLREIAAMGLGEIVEVTSPESLKPYLVKTTGPLIRVVGDKFPSGVKSAILQTLTLLLEKGGAALRPFVPQLQTTFVKALSDPMKQVRQRGARALGMLMGLSTRVDPLITELSTGVSSAEAPSARATMLEALANVLSIAGSKATPAAIEKASQLGISLLGDADEDTSTAAAKCVGAATAYLDDASLQSCVLRLVAVSGADQELPAIVGKLAATTRALETSAAKLIPLRGELLTYFHWAFGDPRNAVRVASCRALAVLFSSAIALGDVDFVRQVMDEFAAELVDAANNSSPDVRREGLLTLKQVSKSCPDATRPHLVALMQPLLAAVKDSNMKVKLVGERAMMYLLELRTRNETLNEYVSAADADSARFVRDYSRRVLARLNPDSDTEDAV